jgi:hypothetical protein
MLFAVDVVPHFTTDKLPPKELASNSRAADETYSYAGFLVLSTCVATCAVCIKFRAACENRIASPESLHSQHLRNISVTAFSISFFIGSNSIIAALYIR